MFTLSWTLFHAIDKSSPLYGIPNDDLAMSDAALVLNVGGVDDSSAQQLHARKLYAHNEICGDIATRISRAFRPPGAC